VIKTVISLTLTECTTRMKEPTEQST